MIFYKKLGFSLFIFGIILGFTGQAHAFSKHIGIRAGISEYNLEKDGFKSNTSTYGGIMGGFRKGPWGLDLSADITNFAQNATGGPLLIIKIDQTMLRIMLSGKYYFLKKGSVWNPYFGIGGGGHIPLRNNSEVPDQTFLTPGGPLTIQTDIEIKNIFGTQISAGTDFRFKPNLALGLEFRYFLLRSEFEADSGRAKSVDPTRITIIEFGLSLKYHFPD